MARRSTLALAFGVTLGAALALARGPLFAGPASGEVALQARLTTPTGTPIPDGTVPKLTFRLFSDPSGGTALWSEVQTLVPVSRGIVSVRLGSTGAANVIPPSLFNGTTRYLEIQINDDAPLTDRVPLVSVPYALSTATVNGKGDTEITPVGTIVDWYRADNTTQPPTNWAICDGHVVVDPLSPFNGKAVPALVGRFTRGLPASRLTTGYGASSPTPYDTGGATSVSLTINHDHDVGSHSHSISNDGDHSHSGTTGGMVNSLFPGPSGLGAFPYDHAHNFTTSTNGQHNHGGNTGGSSGRTGSASPTVSFDPTPSFAGLIKIIRIR